MWTFIKVVWKPILINLPAGLLIFMGRNPYFFHKLNENGLSLSKDDIGFWQACCFFLGIIWGGLYGAIILPYRIHRLREERQTEREFLQIRLNKKRADLNEMVRLYKGMVFAVIKGEYRTLDRNYKTKIYAPKDSGENENGADIVLEAIEVDGITDHLEGTEANYHCGGGRCEGMIGKTFMEKAMIIDYDLSNANTYERNEVQKLNDAGIEFRLTFPVMDRESNVICVLVVECEKKIKKGANVTKAWEKYMKLYGAFVMKTYKINDEE